MGNNKESKVFLEDLVRYESGRYKGKIDWKNSIGKKVKFIYDDNQGEVEIVGYENEYVKFIYEGKRFEMLRGNFTKCQFGKLFSKLIKDTTPELKEEWDKEENDKLGIKFEEATTGSNKSVNWICKKDSRHKWEAMINDRTNGSGCPYCVGKKVLKGYNDLFTTQPKLENEWNWEKNNELNIYPYELSCGSDKKVWWKCEKGHEWEGSINKRTNGQGCPYCSCKKVLKGYNDLFTTQPKLESEWNWEKNNELNILPYEISCGSNKKVWWKCEKGHEWEGSINKRTNGQGCPYCSGRRTLKGYNDIATTHSHLVKYFANKEDAYKYTAKSNKKVLMKCTDCGETKMMVIQKLSSRGFGRDNCGDGVSYPEKIVREILKELNIEFIKELNSKHKDWIVDNKRYDFYFKLNNEEYIIETHGRQHYDRGFERCGGRALEAEQENDKFKKELALKNGIKEENYIILDCRNSELEWIKNSIMDSRMAEIFDLSGIDWMKIEEKSTRIIVKEVCEFYENNKDTMTQRDIAKEFDIGEDTLRIYLKRGNKIGWCSYSAEVKIRKVICLNFNKHFNSLSEASKEYGLRTSTSIMQACQDIKKSAGKHPQTNEPLHWMYLDEFEVLTPQEQEELLSKYKSKE